MKNQFMSLIVAAFALCLSGHHAYAVGLSSNHVLVVANSNDPASMRVADHYTMVRNIPKNNRLNLELPIVTDLSRSDYRKLVAQPIRNYLNSQRKLKHIRCIVLSYNLPLRIKNSPLNKNDLSRLRQLTLKQHLLLNQIKLEVESVNQLATSRNHILSPPANWLEDYNQAMAWIQIVFNTADIRISAASPFQQLQMRKQLLMHRNRLFGASSLAVETDTQFISTHNTKPSLRLKEHIEAVDLAVDLLHRRGDNIAQREAQRLQETYFGLIGAWQQSIYDIGQLTEISGASLDSELAMLYWNNYPLANRVLNTATYQFENIGKQLRQQLREPKVLITARLHAGDEQTAMRMINDAIFAETKGLAGNVFLDARSINAKGYQQYDKDLLDLANQIKPFVGSNSPLQNMILDQSPAILPTNSGEQAAIYCGWYSVQNYNAPLKYVRGAVGIHIASYEATDFSDGTSDWVPNLLKDGCAVSVGAVNEPYLDAFPLPNDFYQLLMTGQYTVGEVYQLTKKYNSWQMTLCGDPLYNPFKTNPVMSMSQIHLNRPIHKTIRPNVLRQTRKILFNLPKS